MMSLSALRSVQHAEQYHHGHFQTDDYHSQSRSSPGVWAGAGANCLGLKGGVTSAQFSQLMSGLSPLDGRALRPNAGLETSRPGYDATFSAPKSVSVLWSQLNGAERERVTSAHDRAVARALAFLEAQAAFARRGPGGEHHEPVKGFVVAAYRHETSRELDPQLHTHCVIANVAPRFDGSFGAIEARHLYRWQRAAGAAYRAELASQLREIGYEVEPDPARDDSFQVRGVPDTLCKAMSRRRQQILAALAKRSLRGAKAAEKAALVTRKAKKHLEPEALHEEWLIQGNEHYFDAEALRRRSHQLQPVSDAVSEEDIVSSLSEYNSTWQEQDVWRAVAIAAQRSGRGLDHVQARVSALLEGGAMQLVRHRETGRLAWTSREMLQLQRETVELGHALKNSNASELPGTILEEGLCRYERTIAFSLSREQAAAVRELMSCGGLALLQAGAGTGKTTIAGALKAVCDEAGFRVRGVAVAAKAAEGLQEQSGIPSTTIARFLSLADVGEDGRVRDGLRENDVVVVDEAGMVGSRDMHSVLTLAAEASAKVILIGDDKQLQPVAAGTPYKDLRESLESSTLTEIRRQKDSGLRQAVRDFSEGNIAEGIKRIVDRGALQVLPTQTEAVSNLAQLFAQDYEPGAPAAAIALANTRAETVSLSEAIRAEMIQRKTITGPVATVNVEDGQGKPMGERSFAAGDRILFRRNDYRLGVRNGSLGVVERVVMTRAGIWRLTVALDGGGRVQLDPGAAYRNLDYGWAVTTHAAQGATVDRAYVLAGGSMQSRESTYVQMSRMREKVHVAIHVQGAIRLAAEMGVEAGDDEVTIAKLAQALARSRSGESALEFEPVLE